MQTGMLILLRIPVEVQILGGSQLLGGESNITSINVIGRYDCCWNRLNGVVIEVLNSAGNVVWTKTVETFPREDGVSWDLSGENIVGSEVRVRLTKKESLSLTEVQVIGSP